MDTVNKNEVLLKDNREWLYFGHPLKIFNAEELDQVIPALQEIEERVEQDNLYAAGFLSYEAAPAFDSALPSKPTDGFPYLWFGLYPPPQTVKLPEPQSPRPTLTWQPTVDRETYHSSIEQIKDHIAEGRTYQVNYTMRLQTDFIGSPWDFFLHLAQSQNNHAAYLDTGRHAICSASPELFFQLDGDTVTCRPMKGTVKRGRTTSEDHAQSQWLKASQKNRAENIMIVDMVRNDLGRLAKSGSVHVPELFNTERYPTLWQMTSTVTAQTNKPLTEIFRALFPSASITGAPKVSTMKIINQLESTPRRIYTGSIGYISPKRKAKFNVAIRTVLVDCKNQKAEYGVGGGIVWDSTSPDEYAEALLKARILTKPQPEFSLLETMLWSPHEGFFLRDKHIERLLDSADYFDFPVSPKNIDEYFHQIASQLNTPQRVRLLLDRDGNITSKLTAHQPTEKVIQACLAAEPINSTDVFLFHKTTQRAVYEKALAGHPDCDDVLLYNKHNELTEFTIGNLIVELDGELVTPPVECGLLPGTFRAHVLETGQVVERAVPVQHLQDCTRIFRVNSIRKWEQVQLQ
ncbi:MAG: aminodeoxychorismate synthase component I [Chloroflexota bacterium]